MTQEFFSIITDTGLEKINESLCNGTKLDLKYIAVGDSDGEYYDPVPSQVTLKNERYRTEISEITKMTVKAMIPATVGGFYLREFGIFDSENNLLLVGKQPETYKPVETEGSLKELWLKIVIIAINPDVIELKVDPNIQMASIANVIELINSHKHPNLMPINIYDTNRNGVVDTCDYLDGGSFKNTNETDVTQPPLIQTSLMITSVYDKNNDGKVDFAENIDAGEF